MEVHLKPPNMELVEELLKFLEENRHCLSGEDIVLLNRVIEELKRAEKSLLNPDQCILYLVRVSELILKLFDVN